MEHIKIDNSEEPIRLFKSDFLEFFTHISPVVVVIIWLPVAVYFFVRSFSFQQPSHFPFFIPVGFLIGLFVWTISEYTLHRFLFHYSAKSERAKRIFFLFHGVHHAQPQCKTRLVMPPVVSIPMALIFYGLFTLIISTLLKAPAWVPATFSGFITGYLVYDLTHYATHHFPMRRGIFKFLKRYHMQHHYKTPNMRFGVSSPLWDIVFHTYPKD
jgi:sterol desaturase/sphingolipid hydroxylase (fatty acid hydroxylase superfamily)